jgi:ATP-binding cassette subfamily C protein LapB
MKPLDQNIASRALTATLIRLAQLRREPLDPMLLQSSVHHLTQADKGLNEVIQRLAAEKGWPTPKWSKLPDAGRLPSLVFSPTGIPGIITASNANKAWVVNWWDDVSSTFTEKAISDFEDGCSFLRLRMTSPFVASSSPSFQLIWSEVWSNKRALLDICAGTVAISFLALVTSLYSMQVYDRVVPTQATSTLLALTLGVALSIIIEAFGKWIRAKQIHALTDTIDQRLARSIYSRFLSTRLDQLPPSIGSTSSRLRSYESIRAFLVNLSTQAIVDIPMALLILGVLLMIGGWIALIPAAFLVLGVSIGFFFHGRMDQLAKLATPAQHQRLGLLVESIEGAETIKSGQGGWRMLSKWLDLTDEGRQYEQQMRHLSEMQQYLMAMLQQMTYVALVGVGAMHVGQADFTMGALIACSILSGRALVPISMIPALIMQWAQTRVAIQDLDRLWTLEPDHPEGSEPLVLNHIQGEYQLNDIQMQYQGTRALKIGSLNIQAGERIAILGGIGSGKTSLLRLLSGMYKPQTGRITLDGIEVEHIAKSSLANQMGFVAQDGRLFAGTLRDNLVLGLQDPGDEVLLQAAHKTGLFEAVIAPHPKGLTREIYEGGSGLSGGQRQLVHITRALLRQPTLWLLDEPTASMDSGLEARVIGMLQNELTLHPKSTLVLVTHKPQLLCLVNRIVILANQNVVMDGPRDQVLHQLQQNHITRTDAAATSSTANAI